MSIQLTDVRTTFAKAIEKANAVKPRVAVIQYGTYSVESSTPGQTYTVEFFKERGVPHADCSCRAGQNGNACYHIPAAFVAWKLHAGMRRQANAGTQKPDAVRRQQEVETGAPMTPRAETFAAAAAATFSTEAAIGVCACGFSAERCELRRDGNRHVAATTTNPTPTTDQSTAPAPILDPLPYTSWKIACEADGTSRVTVQTRRFTHVELERVSYPTTARVADYASPEYQSRLRKAEQDLFG